MGFWDWLFRKPKDTRADALAILLKEERSKNTELHASLVACQTDRSKIFSAGQSAIREVATQLKRVADLEIQLTSFKDDNDKKQMLLDNQSRDLKDLQATCERRQGTIDNLKKQRDVLNQQVLQMQQEKKDITPEQLSAFLIAKYPQGMDVSKIWDEYAEAVTNAFAIKLIDPVKEISASEFRDSIVKAFPGIKFNSMLMESLYFCPSCSDIIRVIRNNWGNLKPYVPERGDCNWFAERLRVHFNNIYLLNIATLVVGPSPFGLHAWSIIKGSDGIVVCEPQNDSVTIIPDKLPGYIEQEIIIA